MRIPSPAPFPKLLDALEKYLAYCSIQRLKFPPTYDGPDPAPCPRWAFCCPLQQKPSVPYVLPLAAVAEPHGCRQGLLRARGALFPQEGGPTAPASPRHPGLGLLGAPAARFRQKRGFPGAPQPVSGRLVVTIGNTVPPSAAPAPAAPAPGTPALKTLPRFSGGPVPQGRSGRPSSVFCSGSFAPAQASVGRATSFKIWPQTFITQC